MKFMFESENVSGENSYAQFRTVVLGLSLVRDRAYLVHSTAKALDCSLFMLKTIC